jgi:hypothetical protein
MKPAIKIEDLNMTEEYATKVTQLLEEFLIDLGYSSDRIEYLDCRRRDGFIPNSHNKGGIEANAFSWQTMVLGMGGTGFENADAKIEEYHEFDVKSFLDDNKELPKDTSEWDEATRDKFDEYQQDDDQSTVLYSCDLMITSEQELNIRCCVCVKDAPYHREYDDLIELDIEFKSIDQLKKKLSKALKNKEVLQFSKCLMEAY